METQKKINEFREFINKYHKDRLLNAISKGEKSIVVPLAEGNRSIAIFNPELADEFIDDPEESFKAAEIACEQEGAPNDFKIRICNPTKDMNLRVRDIRTKHIGKLVAIEGVIRQTSDIRPQVTSAKFECPSCGNIIPLLQLDNVYKEPRQCGCGRKGKFNKLSEEKIDCQRIKIEEPIELMEGNEQPRSFNVILTRDLTDPEIEKRNTPGSRILVVGVINDVPVVTRAGSQSTVRDLMLTANYIEAFGEDFDDIELLKEDIEEIKRIAKSPDLFERLTSSYCPEIHGYNEIKLAIILQLFGGVKKEIKELGMKKRGVFHILLMGDPSAGKTKLIKYAMKIAPKARYSSGSGSSGKGLTASVEKDEFLGGWSVRAGALVLAHKGILIADEIDKMSQDDRGHMHEGLSDQIVPINKAGVNVTLQAETSVLVAGNPKHSRFDPYSTVFDQINLPFSLLTRFDFVFPVKDVPNESNDEKIISRILDLHRKKPSIVPDIEPTIFKKYIAYARQNIEPELTLEAETTIKDFYLSMRKKSKGGDPIAATTRQAEGIIRVAEACAKARLSSLVEKQDVDRVKEIILYCLNETATDPETGKLDVDLIESKVSSGSRNQIHLILDMIRKHKEKNVPEEDIINEAMKSEIPSNKTETLIEYLKRNGEVFSPRPGFIRLVG